MNPVLVTVLAFAAVFFPASTVAVCALLATAHFVFGAV